MCSVLKQYWSSEGVYVAHGLATTCRGHDCNRRVEATFIIQVKANFIVPWIVNLFAHIKFGTTGGEIGWENRPIVTAMPEMGRWKDMFLWIQSCSFLCGYIDFCSCFYSNRGTLPAPHHMVALCDVLHNITHSNFWTSSRNPSNPYLGPGRRQMIKTIYTSMSHHCKLWEDDAHNIW